MKNRNPNPLVRWILGVYVWMPMAAPTYEKRRTSGKTGSKCIHGPRGKAGDKLARMAAEHRLTSPSGRPI
jgi:hypothetical protein